MLDSGGGGGIFVEVEAMVKTLSDMGAGAEELPAPSVMRENIGSGIGVTEAFKQELVSVGGQLATLISTMKTELTKTQEAVRLAVSDMVAMDGALADEAAAIIAFIDSAVEPTPAKKPVQGHSPSPTAVDAADAPKGYSSLGG